ncbi:ribosomal protein S20, partial [Vibrio parahaemolyticus VPTS-2010_2]
KSKLFNRHLILQ